MPGTPYNYMGTWNASSGSPPASSPSVGDVYLVTTAGHNTLNSGTIYAISEWYVGDQAVFLSDVSPAGENWYKLDGINRDIPSILDWGADPTGATDSTAAINNAIAFVLAAGGGDLLFPIGNYLHSGLTVNPSGTAGAGFIRLVGLGDKALPLSVPPPPQPISGVRLLCTSATADHLFINNCDSVEVDGIGFFDSDGIMSTGGWVVRVLNGQSVTLKNVFIGGGYNGLLIDGSDNPIVEDVDIEAFIGDFGMTLQGSSPNFITQGRADRVYLNSNQAGGTPRGIGIQINDGVSGMTWTKVGVSYATYGLAIGSTSGDATETPSLHRFYDFAAENCNTGIFLQKANHCWFNNTYVAESNHSGIYVNSTMDQYGGPIYFVNILVNDNKYHGVELVGSPLISFTGGVIGGNSTDASGTYDGIRVSSPTAYFSVIGTRIGGDATDQPGTAATQRYGINITANVTAPSFIIDDVDASGNLTGALFDGSSATPDKIIGSIIGFNKLATSLPNVLVNGAFQVWQRGTSFNLGASAPCADYWVCRRGSGGGTLSRGSPGPVGSQYYARLQRPSGDTTTSLPELAQVLTTADSLPFVGTQICVAFFARAGANFSGGTLQSKIVLGTGTDQTASQALAGTWTNQTVYLQNSTLSTGWQLFTQPLSIPATLSGSPTSQIAVEFYYTPSGTAGTADYVDIGLVSLQTGYGPPLIEIRPYWLELSAAQRRFRKSFPAGTAPAQNTGSNAGAAYVWLSTGQSGHFAVDIPLKPPMRAAPTVITYNPSANNANWHDATNNADRTLGATMDIADSGFHLDGAGGAAASANYIHWTADAELT